MGAVIDATGRTGAVFAVAAGACVLGAAATALAGAAARRRALRGPRSAVVLRYAPLASGRSAGIASDGRHFLARSTR